MALNFYLIKHNKRYRLSFHWGFTLRMFTAYCSMQAPLKLKCRKVVEAGAKL